MKLERTQGVLLILIVLMLSGCSPARYQPPPIATPGHIDPLISKNWIPLIVEWKYDDHMLVYHPDCNECNTDLELFSWNLRKDELTKIPLPGMPIGGLDVAESVDPNLIVYSNRSKVHLYNLMTHQDEVIADGNSPEFSPTGDQIVFGRNQALILFDLQTRQERVLYSWKINNPKHKVFINEINWSPDGKKIAYIWEESYMDGNYENRIAYIDVNSKEETIVDSGQRAQLGRYISWSPDSRLLTYVRDPITEEAQLVISEVRTDCTVGTYPIPRQDGTAAWSPDGKEILVRYWNDLFFVNVENIFGKAYSQLSCTK